MMQLAIPRSWREEFERAATAKREEAVHWEQMRLLAALDRERRKKHHREEERERADRVILEAAWATFEQVGTFRIEIDDYGTKTVESLMENREAMELVQRRIDDMLGRAEVLPDGRRVFKTIDGTQVFDEHGTELSREEIDPDGIDDKKPKWEAFKAEKEARIRLEAERQQLLDYQDRLDQARERLDAGDITQKELDALKAELKDTMPEAVRRRLDQDTPKAEATMAQPTTTATVIPDGMDRIMRNTGLGPTGP